MSRLVRCRAAATAGLLAAAALGASALAGPAAASQDGHGPEPLEIVELDTGSAPEVTVTVALPSGLDAAAVTSAGFTATVDGAAVPVRAVPLRSTLDVVVLIDTSGSMAGARLDALRGAVAAFVQGADPAVRIGLVAFATGVEVLARPGDPLELTRLQGLRASGNTATWDALVAAAAMGDRDLAVVLVADGEDNASTATAQDAIDALTARGAALFVAHLSTPVAAPEPLAGVAAATGGRFVDVEDPAGLATVYDGVADRLNSLWRVSLTSPVAGPQDLAVEVTDGTVVARTVTRVAVGEAPPLPAPPLPSAPAPAEPATGPAPVPAPGPEATVRQVGPLEGPAVLWAGAGLVGAALAVLALVVGLPAVPTRRLSAAARSGEGGLAHGLVNVADRALSADRRGRMDRALERADVDLRPAEAVVVVLAATAPVAALVGAVLGPLLAPAGLAVPLVTRLYLGRRASRRRARFAEQLPDTLLTLTAALRSGRALSQALEMVATEAPEPTASEFGRVVIETRLGRDLVESLERAAERTASDDFAWAVRAMAINRELGGDLAEVLDNVADTIRDRAQIGRHVRSLSAEGRLSAWVLLGLPVVVALAVSRANPGYLDLLVTEPAGRVMVAVGLGLFALGGLWIRRIVSLRY